MDKFCKEVSWKRAALLRKICYTQLTSLFRERQLLRNMKTRAIAQLCETFLKVFFRPYA